ncbi:MAG TPA: hypothetical protein VLB68_28450 [Pyrinomonadaceae bacterium]|nr:hypothetical protein [Pyrinomonadaceae bacterium]
MATQVKIVKKNRPQETLATLDSEAQKPHEPTTRDMVRTIKSWVTEFQDRKRQQTHSLPDFPVMVVLNEQSPSLSLAN